MKFKASVRVRAHAFVRTSLDKMNVILGQLPTLIVFSCNSGLSTEVNMELGAYNIQCRFAVHATSLTPPF